MIEYNSNKKITIIYLILSVVVILVHGGVGVVVLRVLRLVLHDLEVPGSLEVVAVLLPGGPDPVGLPDVQQAAVVAAVAALRATSGRRRNRGSGQGLDGGLGGRCRLAAGGRGHLLVDPHGLQVALVVPSDINSYVNS